MTDCRHRALRWAACWFTILATAHAAETPRPILDCFISTGDNHWMGSWLPIDTPASIEASFDLLKRVGVRRVYWRGLQEAAWLDTMHFREENCRYASFWKYLVALDKAVPVDRLAVAAAHRRGMEIWGVGTMFDWGSAADTPCFGDFPHNSESRLRIEHPEWVPVDRQGALRQGGPIDFSYPDARAALTTLHMKFIDRDGYDGMALLTYVENFSLRFPDEFGYNEPALAAFQKATSVNLLAKPFERGATRFDWQALRGDFVTQYLRELKSELTKRKKQLGVCLNPVQPRLPQFWTAAGGTISVGHLRFDLDTWARESIVDQFIVWGGCYGPAQLKTVSDCLWLARDTQTGVAAMTSSPFAERWAACHAQGVPMMLTVGDDFQYVELGVAPQPPPATLADRDPLARLRALAAIARGKSTAPLAQLAALAGDENLLVRRASLLALAKQKDAQAVPLLERALADPEPSVACVAALALRDLHGPQSARRLLAALAERPTHPLLEIVATTLPRIQPTPRAELVQAAQQSDSPMVRVAALRALAALARADLVPTFAKALADADRYVRFSAAHALGNVTHSAAAVEVLLAATAHDDPVVADRAATSLAQIAVRRQKETEPLREKMLVALETLYAKLGQGCQRADADWGYRPVGNALLKFGADGEQILQKFLAQRKDLRLAEQAWKSLYVPLDNGAFSESCEKEAQEAIAKRPLLPRDLRVDPKGGDDASAAGPFKTIAAAIKAARPGDTIHLAPGRYKESVVFQNRSGEPGRPITLDGHGATLDGAESLTPADWEQVSPGLYRNAKLLRVDPAILGRFYFVFAGKMNHMGRTSKGPHQELKKPEALVPGEWTYVSDAPIRRESKDGRPWDAQHVKGAFYIRIDPAKKLADYQIEAPLRASGVALAGRCEHLVIRNVRSTHVYNDGFNIHGYSRDILFENIAAIDCGDDGVSAHDDCQIEVRGLISSGNSTGICDVGDSVSHYQQVLIRDCLGHDVYFLDTGEHSLRDSLVLSSAWRAAVFTGRDKAAKPCTVQLENVLFKRVAGAGEVRVLAGAAVDARHVTLDGLSLLATGGKLKLSASVVGGKPQGEIILAKELDWHGQGNWYDVRSLRWANTVYMPKTFADYQQTCSADPESQWTDQRPAAPGVGVDPARLPHP